MRIGFDAKRLFHNYTGLGNYSRTLVDNLSQFANGQHEIHLYSPKLSNNQRVKSFHNPSKFHLHKKKGRGLLWRSKGILKDVLQDKIDIYHGLSHELPLGINKQRIKSVVSMHDLIFFRYPEFYPWIDRQIYTFKFKHAAKQADRVLAISECTKQELIHFFHTPEDKIEVLYQACDEQFYEKKSEETIKQCLASHQLPDEYLLYVGSITERKNLLGLVQAIESLPTSMQVPLLILGNGKTYKQKVQSYIQNKGLSPLFLFREQVPFHDFPALYQQAKALIYPSFFEGFGIPIIEALWSETPVISSRTSSMPEAGGPDSLYIDPEHPEEIAHAIEQVLSDQDLTQSMKASGKKYVQRFHGRTLTEKLLHIYQNL